MGATIQQVHTAKRAWWIAPLIIVLVSIALLIFVPIISGAKAAYLWTDYLFFALLFLLVFGISYIRTQYHLSSAWKQVFTSKVAMISTVILLSYIFIALLDSLHFRTVLDPKDDKCSSGKSTKKAKDSGLLKERTAHVNYSPVESVLDLLLISMRQTRCKNGDFQIFPLRLKDERTYSAPLALRSYAKETQDLGNGKVRRHYPKLVYGGRHLAKPADWGTDIFVKLLIGVLLAVIVWSLIIWLVILRLNKFKLSQTVAGAKKLFKGQYDIPWNVAVWTLLIVLIFSCCLLWLSFYYHVLGTDKVGQDTLYQAVKSIRTGILIGTLTTLVMLPFAIFFGIAAGYFKGWVDDLIQYIYTTLSSIPSVLLIAASILVIQVSISRAGLAGTDLSADYKLLALCVILGITSWTSLCRLLRGESLKIREVEYIQAAQAFGVKDMAIIRRHIIPNIMHIVLIVVVLDFSGLVLAEAVLSYIGIGVDAKMNSWGNMINSARLEMAREPMVWWSLVAAMGFMFTLVLAANMFSDAVRDAFDPRLRKG